ncbi:YdcF family protein [Nocardiopsis halotolerans]|uniref:YdcF family protein n=1 Tax=Nocardiopsis halotolerans TaxID=124252 RepID=UPI00034CFDF5|nr:ElyC/SanA/YdcF family protein [Nocardiopsis halotolerans]
MRTVNDGRGEEPWEDPTTARSPDDEATRVFSRDAFVPADGVDDADGADDTRALSADDESTREFRRDETPPGARAAPADQTVARGLPHVGDPPNPDDIPNTDGLPDVGAPPDADTTQAFGTPAADAPEGSGGTAFTRRFVRERPLPRTRAPGSSARPPTPPPAPGPSEEEVPPVPEPDPLRDHRPEPPPPPSPRPRRRGRRRFRLRWLVALMLVAALATPCATWVWVWYVARQDERAPTDAIVVLGASQYNGDPSPVFEARLRHAQVLYLEGVAPFIVTVGGKMPGDNFTEAASGRNWLMEVGIPGSQVIAVQEGRDTLQSIDAVAEIFEAHSWDSATIVSDPWHSLRSEQMIAYHGIEAMTSPTRTGPAVIERSTQLWYISRETAALWYYWIFRDSSGLQVEAA